MIHTPSELINPTIEADPSKPNLKFDFYEQVLGKISSLMLDEMSFHKPAYMNEIINFFRVIIVKFFARDTLCHQLSDIVGSIFNWERNLHQKVLSKLNHAEILIHDKQLSLDYKRVKAEQAWRDQLKAGDLVDVVKHVRIKDQTLRAWSRGMVVYRGTPEDQESKSMDMDESPIQ